MNLSNKNKALAVFAIILCLAAALLLWWLNIRFPVSTNEIGGDIHGFVSKTVFHVGGQPVRIWFIIKSVVFLLFLSILSNVAQRFIRRKLSGNPRFGQQQAYVFSKVVSLLIYVAGILIGIHVERINLSTLTFIGGALGVGVGFGLQGLVANFVAGLILLIEQPIRLGDRIEFGDKTGEVTRVGMRASWIKTYDNAILIVPNAEFTSKQILNWTASDPKIRISVPISVSQGTNPEQVIRILLELATTHEDVMEDPGPEAILFAIGPHSITFELRAWTLTRANDFVLLRSDLYRAILKRFEEDRIQIPFPQLDLHVKNLESAMAILKSPQR